MSERNPISKRIVHRGNFLKLPCSSKLLYLYLVVFADKQGTSDGKSIMNMVKAAEDDLKILEERGFIKKH